MGRSDKRTMASVEREEQELITDMIRDAERTLELEMRIMERLDVEGLVRQYQDSALNGNTVPKTVRF